MMPAPKEVWLVVEAVDTRAGIDVLSQRIQNTVGRSPCDVELVRGWGALHAAGARGDRERRIGAGLFTLVSRVQHAEPKSQCSPKPDLTPTF
jgi:hypothetical protein